MTRGTSNGNSTGSSTDRRRRKQWLLREFGDGVTALCAFGCGTVLTFETITVDRFPLAGCEGGRYVHSNIRPACAPCNTAHGSALGVVRKKQKRLAVEAALG